MLKKVALIACLLFGFAMLFGQIPSTAGWYQIPNTALTSVCACTQGFPNVCAVQGCPGIFDWGGGSFDTKRNRLIIWGGGHNDYFGNELYALSLDSLNIRRITDPGSTPVTYGYQTCPEAIANGTQPNSRHTYDGLAYMEHIDRMFIFGGALACGYGYTGRDTWTFDFATNTWHRMTSSGTLPASNYGVVCDYDPNTRKVFLHDNNAFYSYSFESDSYTKLADNNISYHMTSVIDPKRKKFIVFGSGASSDAYIYDIGGNNYAGSPFVTTGATGILGLQYPGLAYDPDRDRIVAWIGGNTVYSLNMDTRVWTADTFSGGPGLANVSGTFKRWRYSAKDGVFIVANRYDNNIQNGYTFRFPSTGTETSRPRQVVGKISLSPNPATSSTIVRISAEVVSRSPLQQVAVYGLGGRKMANLKKVSAGEFRWDGSGVPAGIYLVEATVGNHRMIQKLTLMK